MRKKLEIGDKEFGSKKEALIHFKTILNSYEFGEKLSKEDFNDVLDLLETHPKIIEKIGVGIDSIRIAKVQYNTKSFELIRTDGSTDFFSYTKRINSPKTDFTKFREACRKLIQEDLREVKLAFFDEFSKRGKVRCQETGELSKYEDLNVDHRQPNTFSVIVDRFIEINNIDLKEINYLEVGGGPNELVDEKIKEEFRQYHKCKANLRIVKKSLNLGRSYQAKVTRQKKDLIIKDKKEA
ncbi:hypothetical protein J2X31_000295 [Flavobacterium arsenatis]|uniref:DUF3223 domain-containing protein n=1 Tax=Flavobacterium arsenatis TaxID=1484332 RepID=A0ABU1TJY7_9FLAO|nr:DCL family protein [Flavobacterium arsenatis]MDR6966302.1 hypothetical protein [Flavobacterium arsenatis]